MNLRDLEYVVLVAELRHFGKAADAAGVSQPTLSSQIKKLEEQLGVALFERDSRNVALTAAGLAIVAEAKEALARVRAIEDVAGEHKDPLAGDLRVGVIASLCPFLVPDLLERLEMDAPRLSVQMTEGLTDNLLAQLLGRELDVVLLASEVAHEGLVSTTLFDEDFLLAHAATHELAKRERVRLQDIPDGDLLLLEEGHCLRDQALEICNLMSLDPRVKATSLTTLMGLVERNRGVTLLPALAAQQVSPKLILRPLEDVRAKRRVRLVARRNFLRGGALKVLENAAKRVAAEMGV